VVFNLEVAGPTEVVYCCDRKSRAAYAQSFALWQQETMEFTCHDHSLGTLDTMFNRSHVKIGRASMPQSLFYCLFAPHICMVLFFTHIPFLVNHTINATPPERLQQYHLCKGRQKIFYAGYISVLHLLYPSLDRGRWVIVGCHNGSRYKKGWKPLA